MSFILHETEHLLVIDKPAGWNTHSPSVYAGEGVYEWLKHREPRWARLAIIHRLDKETSGVMVFGKTPEANRSLTEQFTQRGVEKRYVLITDRAVAKDEFTVVSSIVRAGERYVSQPLRPGAERAETHFRVLSRENDRTIVEARPVTGRTHQIRVHAAESGFPILGDSLYGGTSAERVFLHAAELSLLDPTTNAELSFSAPPDWLGNSRIRDAVIDPVVTNAFRLLHGAADGSPSFYVDKLGDWLLAQTDGALKPAEQETLELLANRHHTRGAYHKELNRHVRKAGVAEASPQLVLGEEAPDRFSIRENALSYQMSFTEGYSVGLFLDQRDNRRRFLVNHVAADFPVFEQGAASAEVLNTFAYTCGFSVAAAKAGARTTSLDLSKKYLEWGRDNFRLNEIDPARHDFIYGDAFDWMRRLAKKGRSYDVIVLDPPTFSQSKESGVWQAEKHYGRLVEGTLPLLKKRGVLLASTNAARLEPEEFLEVIRATVQRAGRRIVQQHYVPQPPDFPITRAEPGYLKTAWLRVS